MDERRYMNHTLTIIELFGFRYLESRKQSMSSNNYNEGISDTLCTDLDFNIPDGVVSSKTNTAIKRQYNNNNNSNIVSHVYGVRPYINHQISLLVCKCDAIQLYRNYMRNRVHNSRWTYDCEMR